MHRTNSYLADLPSVALAERHQLPSRSGIYFAFADPADVLYVGMTHNLRQRWRSHHRATQLARRSDVRIHYLTVDEAYSVPMLASLERYCIGRFDPLLNTTPTGWTAERRWLIGIIKKLIADKRNLQRQIATYKQPA